MTLLQGSVALMAPGQSSPQPLQAFMKLRRGDQLDLAEGARVQILYTASGRQETWSGGAKLMIGEDSSRALFGAPEPQVRKLPSAALTRLAQAPRVMTELRNRSGMVMIRSGRLLDCVHEVERTYNELRANTQADDVTPELYLLSALHELNLHNDIPVILEDMRAKQPDNHQIQAIIDQMKAGASPGASP